MDLPYTYEFKEGKLFINLNTEVTFSQFGMKAPSIIMAGTIKVAEEVQLQVDLVLKITNHKSIHIFFSSFRRFKRCSRTNIFKYQKDNVIQILSSSMRILYEKESSVNGKYDGRNTIYETAEGEISINDILNLSEGKITDVKNLIYKFCNANVGIKEQYSYQRITTPYFMSQTSSFLNK